MANITAPLAFAGCLVLAAVFSAAGGRLGFRGETVLVGALVAGIAWWSTVGGAVCAAIVAWPFFLGFVHGMNGELRWTPDSLPALELLLVGAMAISAARKAVGRGRS